MIEDHQSGITMAVRPCVRGVERVVARILKVPLGWFAFQTDRLLWNSGGFALFRT
ncbi:MAG TPA: hypothetical protein VGE72_14575 [Azospirillum sp.]